MPYIPGGNNHGVVHVADVYHSGNVYANNVPIALWQSPGGSGTFGGISVSVSVELDPVVVEEVTAQVNTYVAAQTG